jgi:4-diphosphocytidyl-2C-methyl-D-erythritol kinase
MREVTASAPGKINLLLRVGRPGADGYHPLVTVFEGVDLRETVTVRTVRSPGIRVRTRARGADGSVDEAASRQLDALPPERHLAARAARALQRLASAGPWASTAAGVRLDVDKRVPVAGGMAGGSADAAATLLACNELWGLGLDLGQLERIGRTLGADVPACLVGGIALGTGRGDRMRLLRPGRPCATSLGGEDGHVWVLALSDIGLATPAVFDELDAAGGPGGGWAALAEPDERLTGRLTGPAGALAGALANDLTEPALRLRPDLGETLDAARRAGAVDAVLSGSGPTVAALARDGEHGRGLARAWRDLLGPRAADVIVVGGPAEGARIEAESSSAGGRD